MHVLRLISEIPGNLFSHLHIFLRTSGLYGVWKDLEAVSPSSLDAHHSNLCRIFKSTRMPPDKGWLKFVAAKQ